jgi:hypothetical protein
MAAVVMGECSSCSSTEPLNADWLCEDCADEVRRERWELDRDYADVCDDDCCWDD